MPREADTPRKALGLASTLGPGPVSGDGATPPAAPQQLLAEGVLPEAGARLGGRYQVRRRLGSGGMGVVFLAFDEALEKEVALKFVRAELTSGADGLDRLRDEVRLAQKVTH